MKDAATPADPPSILIVDDDTNSLTLLASLLDEKDYTLVFATRGEDALARAQEGPALMLLDYQLPDLDGLVRRALPVSGPGCDCPAPAQG
jgi:CheY-like chemotaxis protein